MPYESPYAAKPATPVQGLRAKVPGSVPVPPKKKKPVDGGLLGGAVNALKDRKKLLDSL